MITKSQATQIASLYTLSLTQRVTQYLQGQAAAGIVGGTFVVDNASAGQALQTRADLITAGWAVAYDGPTQTATIS